MWQDGTIPQSITQGKHNTTFTIKQDVFRSNFLSIAIQIRLPIKQSNLPAWLLRCSSLETLSGSYTTGWNMQRRNQVNGELYCIPVSNFTVFQSGIWIDFTNVGIMSSQVVLKIWLEFESLFHIIRQGNVKIRISYVDFRPKLHILCSQCS